MKQLRIVDVKTFMVKAPLKFEEEFWEERLIRPIDIYPKYRQQGPVQLPRISKSELEVTGTFVEISTDGEVTGISGPIQPTHAYIIENNLKPLLVGEDPFELEKLWDQMYRYYVHGRKCEPMMAISAINCALWDVVGKARNEPVYRLLGGPTREKVPAYASTLGLSIKPQDVAKRSAALVEEGYMAMKWFFRHGPADGVKGVEKNLELVKAMRDAVGYDVQLMVDCWMSWSVPYTIKMARKLERYELAWIEEPLLPDDIDGYAQIAAAVETPISGGEHEYTRWGFKELINRKAVDILQPDIMWAGGISEVSKICALASASGLPVVPHSGNAPLQIHTLLSQTPAICPIAEYLVKYNVTSQIFFKEPLTPEKGFLKPPKRPGLGIEFDEGKITRKGS